LIPGRGLDERQVSPLGPSLILLRRERHGQRRKVGSVTLGGEAKGLAHV
jgi:hypothetical protein